MATCIMRMPPFGVFGFCVFKVGMKIEQRNIPGIGTIISIGAALAPAGLAQAQNLESLTVPFASLVATPFRDFAPKTQEPIKIDQSADVISRWSEGRFFVKGDVHMDPSKQKALAALIAQKYPNWTVLIMESAQGERYTDPTGVSHRDTLAVANRLGYELPSKTGWGEMTDPKTGLTNGVMLMIVCDDRQNGLSFKGGEAYDQNGIGDEPDNWTSGKRLIDLAGDGMRDGLNTYKAVLNTIEGTDSRPGIERRLQRIESEREETLSRSRSQAEVSLEGANKEFESLKKRFAEFKATFPNLSGDLSRPDLVSITNILGEAGDDLKAARYGSVKTKADRAREQTIKILDAITGYSQAKESFNQLRKTIAEKERDNGNVPEVNEARTSYATGFKEWSLGNSSYKELLRVLEHDVPRLDDAIRTYNEAPHTIKDLKTTLQNSKENRFSEQAKSEIETAQKLIAQAENSWRLGQMAYHTELKRASDGVLEVRLTLISAENAAKAKSMMTTFFIFLGLLGGAGTLGVMGIGASRRKKVAEKLINDWDKKLTGKGPKLLKATKDARVLVGESRSAVSFTGKQSRELALQVIKDVGNLALRYKLANSRLESARAACAPSIGNRLLSRNFNYAISLLGDQKFDIAAEKDVQLELGEGQEKQTLVISKEDVDGAKALSFDQIIKDYNQTAERVEQNLAIFREGVLELNAKLASAKDRLAQTVGLASNGNGNGTWFKIADVEGALRTPLAAAISAVEASKVDEPVEAVFGLRSIEERLTNAAEVVATLAKAQTDHGKFLTTVKERFSASAISWSWVEHEINAIRQEAALKLQLNGNEKHAPQVEAKVVALIERVKTALELDTKRVKIVGDISAMRAGLDRSQAEIAKKLSVDLSKVFKEDIQPESCLDEALEGSQAALKELSAGKLKEAEQKLEEGTASLEKAELVIKKTLEALGQFEKRFNKLKSRESTLPRAIDESEGVLRKLAKDYNSQALRLGEGDNTHPRADDTVENNIVEIREAQKNATELTQSFENLHKSGKILEGTLDAEQAEACYALIDHLLGEIKSKDKQLEKLVEASRLHFVEIKELLAKLKTACEADEVTEATQALLQKANSEASNIAALLKQTKGNPFEVQRRIDEAHKLIQTIEKQLKRDDDEFTDLTQSLALAKKKIGQAHGKFAELKRDEAPDDLRRFGEIQRQIHDLETEHTRISNLLKRPHSDWYSIDNEADNLTERATRLLASLEEEEERSISALKEIRDAKAAVKKLGTWSSDYSVHIDETAGTTLLRTALQLFEQGQHAGVLKAAADAAREASTEWQRAQRAESRAYERHQEQLREAAEAARRHQEALRRAAKARAAANATSMISNSVSRSVSSGVRMGGFGGGGSGVKSGGW